MPGETLAEASVRIVADFDTFEPEVKRRLREAVKSAADQAEKDFDKAGARHGKAYSDALGKTIKSSAALDDVGQSARGLERTTAQAAEGISRNFQLPLNDVQRLEQTVTRANDAMADSSGRVRVAEARLNDLRKDSKAKASAIVAAEEDLAKAQRGSVRSSQTLQAATEALLGARERLLAGADKAGEDAGNGFGGGFRRGARRSAGDGGDEAGGFFSQAFLRAASKSVGQGMFRVFATGAASLVTAASPLSTVLGGAVAATVALGGALGQAAGAGLSLGGVLGSLGLAAVAVKVGSQGLGDAWKEQAKALAELNAEGTISEGTQKKLDAALKNLAPSAAAAVKELAAMAPAWDAVRRSVQEKLFAGVSQSLAQLGNTYLPILNTQLGVAAQTLNRTGHVLATFLSTPARSGQITAIFQQLNSILATLLQPLGSVTGGLLDLFTASLPFAQQLANVINSVALSFGEWLGKVADSDGFQTFMQNAMQTAGTLLQLLGNIASIIGQVFAAGADQGAGFLVVLRDLTGQAALFLSSADGKAALASFFSLIGQAGQVLINVFTTLQPLLSGIGALFDALQPALQALGAALTPVIAQLAGSLGAALGQLAPVLGTLVVALTPVVTIVGQVLVGALDQLLPVIVQLVGAFAQMVPVLAPIIAMLGAALLQALAQLLPVIVQLVPVLVQFVTALVTGLQPVLAAILPIFPQLAAAAAQILIAFVQLLPSLLPLIPSLVQLSLSMTQLVLAVAPVIVQFAQLVAVTLNQMAPALTAIVGFIVPVITSLTGIVNVVTRVVSAIVGFVSQAIGLFTSFRAQGQGQIQALVSTVTSLFSGMIGSVVGFFQDMVADVLGVLGGWISSAADTAGRVGSAIIGAVRSGLSGLAGVFSGPFDAARDAVSGAIDRIVGVVSGAVDRIQGLVSKISGAIGKVSGFHLPNIDIPGFADGGLQRTPTLATIAEDGPEVVIPLSKPRRRDELLDKYFTGWDGGGAYKVGRSTTYNTPVHIYGQTVEEVAGLLEDRYGLVPVRGIDTAGGQI